MPKILITGGAGYIGSHTAIELLAYQGVEGSFDVVSIDSFINSTPDALERVAEISGRAMQNYAVDIRDKAALKTVFQAHPDIVGVIHFAALKSVGESVEQPLLYYENNVQGLVNIIQCCIDAGVKNLIFSSSCSVYGNVASLPVSESTPLSPTESPYAYTKLVGEQMLRDIARVHDINCIALRYFNPVGGHPSGRNGESPRNAASNVVPVITETAAGLRPSMTVFGQDWATRDGTCVRDYIHVCDIAKGHLDALRYLLAGKNQSRFDLFNLGSGQGVTVLEAIHAFEEVSGQKLTYQLGARRPGDVEAIYSDSTKAKEILGWVPAYGIREMMASAWAWQQQR